MQVKSETGNYFLDINNKPITVYNQGIRVFESYHLGNALDYIEGKVTEHEEI